VPEICHTEIPCKFIYDPIGYLEKEGVTKSITTIHLNVSTLVSEVHTFYQAW